MWKTASLAFASTDLTFTKTVTPTTGKTIKAGGYWISGETTAQVHVYVNGPSIDTNGDGVQWVVSGYYPVPPTGGYTVTVYYFED